MDFEKEKEETQLKFRMNKIIEEQISPKLPKITELETVNEVDEALGNLVKELKLPKEWDGGYKFKVERVFKGFRITFEKIDGECIFSGDVPCDWVTVGEVDVKKEAPKKEEKVEPKEEKKEEAVPDKAPKKDEPKAEAPKKETPKKKKK